MKIRAKKVLSLALAAAVTFSTVLFGNGMVTKAADVTLGAKDYTTGFWGAHSEAHTVVPHTSSTVSFTNHGGAANYNNFVVVLNDPDTENYAEIGVVRADNWGWDPVCNFDGGLAWVRENNWNWDTLVSEMSEAEVSVTVVNNGGTADVLCNIVGKSGAEFFQNYKNIPIKENVDFHFTVDGCYLDIHEGVVQKEADNVFSVTDKGGKAVEDVAVLAGTELEYVATYNPTALSTEKTVSWKSSNEAVATVKDGKVVAVAAGEATITASAFTHEVSFKVTVSSKPVPTTDFTATADKTDLVVNGTAQISTAVIPADTTDVNTFKFESTNTKVLTVDATGKVTAVGAGKASVKVTSDILKTSKNVDFTVSGDVKKQSTTVKKTTTVTVGSKDCSTGWWTAFSDVQEVAKGKTVTVDFKNYTDGKTNWNNFLVVLQNVAKGHSTTDDANYKEYGVFRADNYGWAGALNSFDNAADLGWTLESNWNWDEFTKVMNGATVSLSVTNNGTTADIKCKIKGSDGQDYYQNYLGIKIDGPLYFCNTVEKGYLEFTGEYEVEKAVFDTKDIYTTEALTDAMKNAIQSVNGGGSIEFAAPEGTVVSKELVQALVDKGVEVTIKTANASFSFGKLSAAVEFNPAVTIGEKVEAVDKLLASANVSTKTVDISFAHDGNLPGVAEVTLDLSTSGLTNGNKVYLYYFNEKTNKFELTDSAELKDGKATFTMKHCSDYVVSAEKLPSSIATSVVQAGDIVNMVVPVLTLLLGAGLVCLVCLRRRTAK